MKDFFHQVVFALVQSISFPYMEIIKINNFDRKTGDFVVQQFYRMAGYLKFGLFIATILFGVYGILIGGRLFYKLPDHLKHRQVKAWKYSKISLFRDFIRFYESLIFLCLFSEIEQKCRGESI